MNQIELYYNDDWHYTESKAYETPVRRRLVLTHRNLNPLLGFVEDSFELDVTLSNIALIIPASDLFKDRDFQAS